MKNRTGGTDVTLYALAIIVMTTISAPAIAQTPQHHVHEMSHAVMPFDMSKTVHIFNMTRDGGTERVVVKDATESEQIRLIQMHLQYEAERFQHGDYSDPEKLHGSNMPGIKELRAQTARIKVTYAPLPDGGQIIFKTSDLDSLTAIHRWFGAQLSEHGSDAKAE